MLFSKGQKLHLLDSTMIWSRLTEDRFFEHVPSVLVTARGMPDLCTRIFLNELISKAPQLIILGLVDWNPSGIAILTTYKHGSSRMGPHANQYSPLGVLSSIFALDMCFLLSSG